MVFKLCDLCKSVLELLPSSAKQHYQCPQCSKGKQQKETLILCMGTFLFILISPFIIMLRTIYKTEKIINTIERSLNNVILIILMNLLISLPLYFGIYVIDLLIFPFELIHNIRNRQENFTYSQLLDMEQF